MAVAPRGTRATQYRKLRKALTNPPGILATQALLGQVVTLDCKAVDQELLALEATALKVVVDLQAATTAQEFKEVEGQEAPTYLVHLALSLTAASLAHTLRPKLSLSSLLLAIRLLHPAHFAVVQPLLLPEPPSPLETLFRQPAELSYPSTLAHLALLSMETRILFPPPHQRLQQLLSLLPLPQLAAIL